MTTVLMSLHFYTYVFLIIYVQTNMNILIYLKILSKFS